MAVQTPSTPHDTSHDVTVEIEHVLDGEVFVVSVANNSRATIDRYVEVVKEYQQDWPPERIGYTILDVTKTLGGFNTPYGRAKMAELANWRPDRIFYIAIIIPNSFIVAVARIVLNNIPRKTIHSHICVTREEAIAWLQDCIVKNKQPAGTRG